MWQKWQIHSYHKKNESVWEWQLSNIEQLHYTQWKILFEEGLTLSNLSSERLFLQNVIYLSYHFLIFLFIYQFN